MSDKSNEIEISIAASIPGIPSFGTMYIPFNYVYIVPPQVSSLNEGGTKTILLPYASLFEAASSTGFLWEAESNDSWIRIENSSIRPMQASNFENLSITIDPNPSDTLRIGSITVTTDEGEDIIHIYQDGAIATIEASQTTIPSVIVGGEYTVDITSNVSWNVFYDADWVSLPYATGTGNNELVIVTEKNDSGEARTATLTIKGGGASKTITITQEAYSESSDASLASLTFNTGTLTPAFNPGVTNYTVSVPYNVNSTTIAATPNQSGAKVSGTGTKNLSVGTNSFTVTVTAPNNTTKSNYTIVVTREQEPATPTSIVFDPPSYSATIPSLGNATVTVSAKVLDQYGGVMQNYTPEYSVTPTYSGVTINSSGGVTINSSTAAGTAYIRATYGSLTPVNAPLALSAESTVGESHYELYFNNGWSVFDDSTFGYFEEGEADHGVYEITLGSSTFDFTYSFSVFASGIDSYGNPINIESIKYVLYDEYENETGVFDAYDVYNFAGGVIKAIAVFSDETVLEKSAYVNIEVINGRR